MEPFLQSASELLGDHAVYRRFPANTAFSFPVLTQRPGGLLDAMFCYPLPWETGAKVALRPQHWMMLECDTGELAAVSSCHVMDFVDTEAHPLDGLVEMEAPGALRGKAYEQSLQELYQAYEQLREFAFDPEPFPHMRAVMDRYCELFLQMAYTGHYPFYYALSPEFFRWLDLNVGESSQIADTPKPPEKTPEPAPAPEKPKKAEAADKLVWELSLEEPGREQAAPAGTGHPPVLEALAELREALERKTEADAAREELIDRLHRELQDYKNDMLDRLTQSMELDVIRMVDDVEKALRNFGDKPGKDDYKRLLALYRGVEEDLCDLLYRHGVEPYQCEPGRVDPTRQKVLDTQPTTDPGRVGTVARRLARGWEKAGKVIRPERVSAYVGKE